MIRLSRPLLLLAALALWDASARAQPVKVQLPPGGPPRVREQLKPLSAEDRKGPDRKRLNEKGLFQLDFEKVDIEKLVQTMSDMTGKLFILPENIRGKITIVGPEHGKAGVTADEAYAAFLSALDANGLTTYQSGRYIRIVEKRAGKQSNIPTILDPDAPFTTNEQMVTKLFKLRYVEAEPVRGVVQQLVSRDGDTIAFPPDTLIINDIGLNLHRISRIIDQLDRPSSADEIRVVQVHYAAAAEVAEKLRQVFDEKNRRPGQRPGQAPVAGRPPSRPGQPPGQETSPASISQLIADERTNKLIIVANENAFERIQELLKHLDQPIAGEGQVHVYYLENANAEELASTLASLTQGLGAKSTPRPQGAAAGAKGQQTVADLFSGEIKITADKATNSLVIIANKADYRNLVRVIQQLDIARRQVFVEAVIMEVNLKNSLDFGISTHGGSPATLKNPDDSLAVVGSQQGGLSSLSGVLGLASMGGFLAGLQGPVISDKFPIPAFSIVLNAMQSSSDVNVLSTPHILTSDNEEAEISVGQNVPFQAGITSNLLGGLGSLGFGTTGTTGLGTAGLGAAALLGGYGGLIAPIQRQNVELKLKIKPQINESDYIRLEIEEQTEEIAEQNATLGPTTAKRAAKTTIVAKDQQTVVIGGLIQDRTVRSVDKVPVLGDIPVIGWLFRDTSTTKTKTNLLLFLTPYIVRDQADFRRIFERKLAERQEFVEQFYGRQPGYRVPIDYARKAGPLAKMLKTVEREAMRAENGGPGLPGERTIRPRADEPSGPPSRPPSPSGEPSEAPAEGEPAPPDVVYVDPSDPEKGVTLPPPPEAGPEAPGEPPAAEPGTPVLEPPSEQGP